MRNWLPALLAASVLCAVPLAGAHLFNHAPYTRHEDCQAWTAPHGHSTSDGHIHTHDRATATQKNLHNHDPCKQVGMNLPTQTLAADGPITKDTPAILPIGADNDAPYRIQEITLEEAALPDEDADLDAATTKVIINNEAYRIPVTGLHKQTNYLIVGDNALRAMGFPGAGTATNPYVIEGKHVTNSITIKDTSLCVVVRNNVIESDAIKGPIIDPTKIIDLEALREYYEAMRDAAYELLDELADDKADWEALRTTEQAAMAALDSTLADFQADQAAWDQAFEDYEAAYEIFVENMEFLADDFEAYAQAYQAATGPVKDHQQFIGDMDLLPPAFEDYMEDADDFLGNSPPPSNPPSGWSQSSWDAYAAQHQAYLDSMQDELDRYEKDILTMAPDETEYADFLAEYAAFIADEYDPGVADFNGFMDDYHSFIADYNSKKAAAQADLAAFQVWADKVASYSYEYVNGSVKKLYNTVEELINFLLGELRKLLNPAETGRLVLDWNGQCVHAYHNVVEDLRVNQNNDRTGYATGGLLQDNRIYTIGQIRHYDGEVRENEIGNRAHLTSLTDPTVKAPVADRSVNGDGANEALFHGNLIYGQIDLDLHGHHHGAGFFTPESHYHGSTQTVSYMTDASGNFLKFPDGSRIPHHDHSKRWTTIRFEDNVVIDPKGLGVKYDDQNHRTDDEKANSENMLELKAPHTHRTWVAIQDNLVVGPVFIDAFNADGTMLWSDDYSEPKTDLAGRITDAITHLGAEIVNSHKARNDGWLDVKDNTVLTLGGGTAVRAIDTKEFEGFAFEDNKAFALGTGFDSDMTNAELLDYLADVHSEAIAPDEAIEEMATWGGTKSSTSTGFLLLDMKDSEVTVCGNSIQGFTRGMVATDRIYTDVSINTCSTNDWGEANPAVSVTFTPYPPSGPMCTEDLRAITDPSVAEYLLKPEYEVVDGSAICPIIEALTPIIPPGTIPTVPNVPTPPMPTPPVPLPPLPAPISNLL